MVTLGSYFEKQASSLSEFITDGKACVEQCENSVKTALKSHSTELGLSKTDLYTVIPALRQKLNFDLEETIKQDRLREAKRLEEELKHKLEFVQEHIQMMEVVTEEPKALRTKLMFREARKAVQLGEEEKAKEAKMLAAKMREERRMREEYRKKVIRENQSIEEQAAKEAEQRKAAQAQETERRKQARIEFLKSLSAKRRNHLSEIQEVTQHSKLPKLTASLSESPKHHHSSSHPTNVSISEIVKEHKQKYVELKKSYEVKKFQELISRKMTESAKPKKQMRYFYDVITEEKTLLKEELEKSRIPEVLANKKKQYASLVKEMYTPSIAREKQLEIERIKAKIHTVPRLSRPIDRTSRPFSLNSSIDAGHGTVRHKPKPVTHTEAAVTKRTDYLQAVRQQRLQKQSVDSEPVLSLLSSQLADLSSESRTDHILQRANSLERKALRRAKALRMSDPLSYKNFEQEVDVDTALLSSVRAKARLLSS